MEAIRCEDVDLIRVAQGGVQWCLVVFAVMDGRGSLMSQMTVRLLERS